MIENRKFMQCPLFREGMAKSDQSQGVAAPAFGKPPSGRLIKLPTFNSITDTKYAQLLDTRRSVRTYASDRLTQAQLAFMLWSVNGIQYTRGNVSSFRPVPSGGARHPFETYFTVRDVEGLEPGLYHYLPALDIGSKDVTVQYIAPLPNYEPTITDMLAGQAWAAKAPVVLFYTCMPYKAEWRYHEMSHRVMLIDLGHMGQNAMLSAAALGLGSCCMAAYNQESCDAVIGIDGQEEYTVYAVSVGYMGEV